MDYLPELGNAMARMASLVSDADGEAQVAACPGWSVRDVVVHLGTMHRWSAAIVLSGQRLDEPEPVVTEPLVDWYAGTATALLAALQAVDPHETVPNFAHLDETAAFWPRRQMHETIVHAVDLAQALGVPEDQWDLTAEIGADGVDEVLSIFFPRLAAKGTPPHVNARVRLTATDAGRSWIVGPSVGPFGTPVLLHPSLEVEAEVRGTATNLYLGLWGRLPHDRLEVHGDAATDLLHGPRTS